MAVFACFLDKKSLQDSCNVLILLKSYLYFSCRDHFIGIRCIYFNPPQVYNQPMSSVNRVTLLGNVGNDPEIKSFSDGNRVCNFSLATSERWKDKTSGERKEKTEWHRVSVTNQAIIGIIEQYVSKGSKLYIEGKLETRKWTDQSGVERYSTEVVIKPYKGDIVLLSGKSDDTPQSGHNQAKSNGYQQQPVDEGDEIPF